MEYPIYECTFDPSKDIGLSAISFVDYPAICQDFVAFSKDAANGNIENIKSGAILMANAEKREIISPIMIPNQLILRKGTQGWYYQRWSRETIETMATYYVLNQFNNNFTIMHEWMLGDPDKLGTTWESYEKTFIPNVYMLRMWIINDSATDEANTKYGYHLPEGTLMVHLKIHNKKLWARIKSGELKGLSIEALVPQVENKSVKYSRK